jgi:hypothetical protein
VHDAIDGAITLGLAALTAHIEEVREDFLATTLHDTQQPITAAKGRIQLAIRALGRPAPDRVRVQEMLRQADASLDRMAGMVATLAKLSRLTLGRLSLAIATTAIWWRSWAKWCACCCPRPRSGYGSRWHPAAIRGATGTPRCCTACSATCCRTP